MRDIAQEIDDRGAHLAVVGSGSSEQARAFAQEQKLPFPVFGDPKLEAYRAAGLKAGLGALVKLKMLANAKRAHKAGFRQGRTQGSATQLGGVFVVHPGGRVALEQRSQEPGDHASSEAILEALP